MKRQKTNFGFREVEAGQKAGLVGEVFRSVAPKYDLMNDLMSFGLHRLWKNHMAAMIRLEQGFRVLDVAGGTGDIAFRLYDKMKKQGIKAHITISDINENMLEEGRRRAVDRGITSDMEWQQANGENLPFEDNSFDLYTIAFGIRNFTDVQKGLNEAYRVLKPGGRFVCMEFTPLKRQPMAKIYDFFSFNIIPLVGEKITGDKAAYQYLVESIRKFPDKNKFAEMLRIAGFSQVKITSLNAGTVAIHSGWKI